MSCERSLCSWSKDSIAAGFIDHNESDDDAPQLSVEALTALREFYAEQMIAQEQRQDSVTQSMPKEDWQLSQFWYDDQTAQSLAEEALAVVKDNGRIACLSCPSVFNKLRALNQLNAQIFCLEYDKRFATFGSDYVFYDYNDPLNLPAEFERNSFDVVIADPPFLSEECLRKTAMTVNFLAKDKVILCTGAVMEELVLELMDVLPCQFKPIHANGLANEFRCYTNYKPLVLN